MRERAAQGEAVSRRKYWEFDNKKWLADPDIRALSVEARGLWFDMLCQMRECQERGVLKTGNLAWGYREVAAAFGLDHATARRLLAELVAKGVTTQRPEDQAYTNRRMTRQNAGRKTPEMSLIRPDDAVVVVALDLSFRGKYLQIKTIDHEKLQLRYPGWDLQAAYREMDDWLDDHPERKRTQFYKFAANWLRIAKRSGRNGYERSNGNGKHSEALVGRGPSHYAQVQVKPGYLEKLRRRAEAGK